MKNSFVSSSVTSTQTELWLEYRRAFDELAEKLERLQSLKEQPESRGASMVAASLELEKAHIQYKGKRDALALQLLGCSQADSLPACAATASKPPVFERAAACC